MPPESSQVLIVEDDLGLAELFRDGLQHAGLICNVVGSGGACRAWLEANTADLMLMDYSLPDLAGAELIASLRAAGRLPPFMVITGHGDEALAVNMMKLGARDYLVKDSQLLDRLPSVVERMLREIRVQKQLEASERRFHTIFESSQDALFLIEHGAVFDCNPRGLELLGFERKEDLIGSHPAEAAPQTQPDGREFRVAAREWMDRAQQGEPCQFEWTLRRRDGRVFPAEVLLSTFEWEGRPVLLGALRDITERKQAEVALQHSEERYRLLLDSVTDYIYTIDLDDGRAKSTTHGPGCITVTGYTPADYNQHPYLWFEMVHPDDQERVRAQMEAALRGEFAPPIEHRLRHKDGSLRWVQSTLVPRRDAQGRLAACDGLVADITARKRAEEALERDEAELAAVYEHAPVMMLLLDTDLRVRRVNQAAIEFTQMEPQSAIGKHSGDLLGCLHTVDDPRGCGYGPLCENCVLRQAVAETLHTGASHHRLLARPALIRGRPALDSALLISTARLQVDNQPAVLLCLEDVTRQQQAEDRVREQATLLDIASDAICVLDLDGKIQFWNHGAERIYGWPVEEVLGRSAEALSSTAAPADFPSARQIILRNGEWSGELHQLTKDRKSIRVQSRGTLVRDPAGQPKSILLVSTDITETKALEAKFLRAQRMESIGALASGVAHDLNNVLAPILMALSMLRSQLTDPADRELLDMLDTSAKRGARIIRQLLTFGRGIEGNRTRVKPKDLLQEMAQIIRETFPKSITLRVDLAEPLPGLMADPTQLHQILLNLCVNARDAMPKGGILTLVAHHVVVSEDQAAVTLDARPGPYILIEVADTGDGIETGLLEKIFDPFFTTKALGQGTGLGLSTVRGIVKSHGGFIEVRSQPGQGTRFRVHLPTSEIATPDKRAEARTNAPGGGGELVLVVDDEETVRKVAKQVLELNGYRVITAGDGAEALALFAQREAEIRAVVMDMMMPTLDGPSTIRTLRERVAGLPIIAISGLPEPESQALAASGPIGFLSKPFSMDTLLRMLHAELNPPGASRPVATSE